jgi:SAM-dependent methyltransferase
VPEKFYLDMTSEKARYDLHDNSINNKGYVKYLTELFEIVKTISSKNELILDYGAGKEAVLTTILKMNEYNCTAYDPLYNHGEQIENGTFDLLIACEVVEHIRCIQKEIAFIRKLLKPQSKIIIRTQLYPSPERFQKWWYIQDLTHINLFTEKTILTLADSLGCILEKIIGKDIFILSKTETATRD